MDQRTDPRLLLLADGSAFAALELDVQAVEAAAGNRQADVRHSGLHTLGLEHRRRADVPLSTVGNRVHQVQFLLPSCPLKEHALFLMLGWELLSHAPTPRA